MVVGTKLVPQYDNAMFGSVCELSSLYYLLPVIRSSNQNTTGAGASNLWQHQRQRQSEKEQVQLHSELSVTSDGTDLNLTTSRLKEQMVHRASEMAVEYGGSPDVCKYKLKDICDEKQETRNMSELPIMMCQGCDAMNNECVCVMLANYEGARPNEVDADSLVRVTCVQTLDNSRTSQEKVKPESENEVSSFKLEKEIQLVKVRVDALPGSSGTLLALKLPVAAIPSDPEVSELDEPLCELCTIANDDVDFWEGKHVKPVVDISISKNSVVDKTVSQLSDLKYHDEISEKTDIPVSLILINEKSEWREWYPKRRRKGGARSSFRENAQSSDDSSQDSENDAMEPVEIYTDENENTSNIGLQVHGAPECFDVMNSVKSKVRRGVPIKLNMEETPEPGKGAKKLQIKLDEDSKIVVTGLGRRSPRVIAKTISNTKFTSTQKVQNVSISPNANDVLHSISVVDIKNDNAQTTSYAEHESICKSTHGLMLTDLSERIPSEQNQGETLNINSCSRRGVENTLNFTGNANIVNSRVTTNVMQPSHRKRNETAENVRSYKPDKILGSTIKRRVSLGNEGIISTVKKTLVRDVGMGSKHLNLRIWM